MHLAANLKLLERSSPDAARIIRGAQPREGLSVARAREGGEYLSYRGHGGEVALASRIDPAREGVKLAAAHGGAGFLACAGLGSLHHLRAALKSRALERLAAVETDPGLCAATLDLIDARDILSDRRFSLHLSPAPESPRSFAESVIGLEYLPALHGSFGAMRSRGADRGDEERYDAIMQGFSAAASSAAADFKVQSSFGYAWIKNAARNLWELARGEARIDLAGSSRIVAAAAGPSLETQLPTLADQPLIACDSCLPYLEAKGVRPTLAMSIDCQTFVYHHFLPLAARAIPSVLDLSSPPCVARLSGRPLFVASAHPLARLAALRLKALEGLSYPGGSVAGAAFSLAARLGAREVAIAGADFSYPRGRLYAKGLYVQRHFDALQSRERTLEGMSFEFSRRDPSARIEASNDGFVIRSDGLDSFFSSIVSFARSAGFAASRDRGGLLWLVRESAPDHRAPLVSGGVNRAKLRRFLAEVVDGMRSIDRSDPASALRDDRRPYLLSALPLAAWALKRQSCSTREALSIAIEMGAKELCQEV
jgi:hypothetical protein